ncbi:Periodic tryptophan protein 1-like protein, partial [Stegodyphus mimosarum]
MNFVPCLIWIPQGVAKSKPDKLQLSPEELKKLVQETKDVCGENCDIEVEDEEDSSGEECETSDVNDDQHKDDSEEDIDTKYDLDTYDNDDEDRPFFNISDVAVHVDNKDDNYLVDHDAEREDEEEEEENFTIKDTDNLLVVGHVEEESSVLEIYVYNKNEDSLYVHHDIVLPSYPLALEWLNFDPSEDKTGNYLAVGDMTPVIKIWDLDVIDVLEPDFSLGKISKKKSKVSMNSHSDAVLSLSWNKHVRTVLASGSADSTIILWDLQEVKVLNRLEYHTNKVQSIQWHPFESPFLLSGCTDGLIKIYDCRSPDTELKSWEVDGEVEKVAWNLFDSFKFFCSTDKGCMYRMDMRKPNIEHCVKAHNEAVTGLDMSPLYPNTLVTASMDKTVKLWNIENEMNLIKSQKLKVGSIYTARVASDLEFTVAVGGNNASNSLKIIDFAQDSEDTKPSIKLEQNAALEPQANPNVARGIRKADGMNFFDNK